MIESLLTSKLLYGGRIRRPPDKMIEEVRSRCAKRLQTIIQLGAIGGDTTSGNSARGTTVCPSADVDMLLAPCEAMGGGLADIRGALLAETAVDLLAMLASKAEAANTAATVDASQLPAAQLPAASISIAATHSTTAPGQQGKTCDSRIDD